MKISIVGIGHVGATVAFSLMTKGLADDMVLVNRTRQKAEGEAADLQHACSFVSKVMRIRAGDMADTRDSDIVILAISVPPDANFKSRSDLAVGNMKLFRHWVPLLAQASPKAIFLVVTNPVDVMTYVTWKLTNLPAKQVIGTGTLIDSARYRALLSEHLQIHPDDIRAYILGEHGETQFPAMSLAAAGGKRFDDDPMNQSLFERALASGESVFRSKGYTNYAIAMATSLIVEAIVHDNRRTIPVSTLIEGYLGVTGVCLSVPAIIGRQGVLRQLLPALSTTEAEQFRQSANKVKTVIDTLTPQFPH